MTRVHGQIETLKKIRTVLNQKGIKRFNSISDINVFIKTYKRKRQEIFDQKEMELDLEIADLRSQKLYYQEQFEKTKNTEAKKLLKKIADLNSKHILIKSQNVKALLRIIKLLRLAILKFRKTRLEKNFNKIIKRKTSESYQKIEETKSKLNEYLNNKSNIVSNRSASLIEDLDFAKKVIDDLEPIILGAIGENLVVIELKKLPDNNVLFNDFSIKFDAPIYNKKKQDRIFSIQIDHLLVTNSGIFIIETKNWSKKSIERFDLRSPIEQIRRTSYALFVFLNSGSKQGRFSLKNHHWGNKQVPIRSTIAMINSKPKEKFKYVQVKTLNELNGYIDFFDPIFDDSEVDSIAKYLEMTQK